MWKCSGRRSGNALSGLNEKWSGELMSHGLHKKWSVKWMEENGRMSATKKEERITGNEERIERAKDKARKE